jgi:VanZ family protein
VHNLFTHSIAIAYTLIILTLSLIRLDQLPEHDIGFLDKFMHLIAYGSMCFFWFLSAKLKSLKLPILYAAGLSFVVGVIAEVLQGKLLAYRTSDLMDILANTAGILTAAILISLKYKPSVKKL